MANIGALNGLAGHRREAQWKVEVFRQSDDLFAHIEGAFANSTRNGSMGPLYLDMQPLREQLKPALQIAA